MRKFVQKVYCSWYGAAVVYFVLLAASVVVATADTLLAYSAPKWLVQANNVLFVLAALSSVNIVAAVVTSLVRKRWKLALSQFAMGAVSVVISFFAMMWLMLQSMFGVSDDHFADNLTIPSDIRVREPETLEATSHARPGYCDVYSYAMMAAVTNALSSRGKIHCDISELDGLYGENPALVRRYWAAHPGWRLANERNTGLVARRRLCKCGRWIAGQDDGWSVDYGLGDDGYPRRIYGSCSVLPRDAGWRGVRCYSGEEVGMLLKKEVDSMNRGAIICKGKSLSLSVDEASCFSASRIMQPVFDFTQREFAALKVAGDDWKAVRSLLPVGSIRKGEPEISIYNRFQGGLYVFEAWVNPGEEGEVYLKAFEVTKGTQLSSDRLADATREYVGWSEDADEKFLASSEFTIYEGDWGKHYAARIEVWFASAKGGPERKLAEDIFKVEGWQR